MKLDKAVFKYIEHELYCYDETVKEIENLKDSIINSSPNPPNGMPKAVGENSDTTGKKACRIISSPALAHMEKVIRCINRVLMRMEEDHKQLFFLKYRQALSWQMVCCEIPISEPTYFRKRRELVYEIAKELGLLIES